MADDDKILRGDDAIAEFQRQLNLLASADARGVTESPAELCDHCDADVAGHRRMICTTVRSHAVDEEGRAVQARVNTQRWWRFCSAECSAAWYAAETEEQYLPTGPAPVAPRCEADPNGEHDFPVIAEAASGPTITIKDGQFRIEHADGRVEEGDYIPGMHLASSPTSICSRCLKDAAELMPKAPHLIDEGEQRDRLFRMVAVHVLPGQSPALLDHQLFDEAHELNDYWRSPGAPVPLGPNGEPATIPAEPIEEEAS